MREELIYTKFPVIVSFSFVLTCGLKRHMPCIKWKDLPVNYDIVIIILPLSL